VPGRQPQSAPQIDQTTNGSTWILNGGDLSMCLYSGTEADCNTNGIGKLHILNTTIMKEILEKLSQYNLFNYLLPGVIYSVVIEFATDYSLIHSEVIITLFICYFVGLVISRVGSLVIEQGLKFVRFIRFKMQVLVL